MSLSSAPWITILSENFFVGLEEDDILLLALKEDGVENMTDLLTMTDEEIEKNEVRT